MSARLPREVLWRVFRQFSLSFIDDDIAGNKVTLLSVLLREIGAAAARGREGGETEE